MALLSNDDNFGLLRCLRIMQSRELFIYIFLQMGRRPSQRCEYFLNHIYTSGKEVNFKGVFTFELILPELSMSVKTWFLTKKKQNNCLVNWF